MKRLLDILLFGSIILGLVIAMSIIESLIPIKPRKMGSFYGSGFFVSKDGVIATAAHVIQRNKRQVVIFRGWVYTAKVLGIDSKHDVALLQIPTNSPSISLTRPEEREQITVYGYPLIARFGDSLKSYTGNINTSLTEFRGLVVIHGNNNSSFIGCGGDSGGPVVNNSRQAVGVFTEGFDNKFKIRCSIYGGFRDIKYIEELASNKQVQLDNVAFTGSMSDEVVIIYNVNTE